MKSIDHYWYSQNFIAWLLLPLSWLFCSISFIRRLAYKTSLFRSYKAPVPVIVVGNITVGGTGKTPLIIKLVEILKQQGLKPGVISRGYGSRAEQYPYPVNAESPVAESGDEPLLIARRAGCPVVIGANRREDIEYLLAENDCNIILSDDGMQHYAMRRDIEIAVVDSSRNLGNGFCIPAGPLRERAGRLKQVDMVLYNGGEQPLNMQIQPGDLMPLTKNHSAVLNTKKVHAIAGIGNPRRFFHLLESLGYEVIPHEFADHFSYQKNDLIFDDELPVIMTEKDAVKCLGFELPRHWYLPIDVQLSDAAQQQFKQLIMQVCNG